jgi:hypothetical protein
MGTGSSFPGVKRPGREVDHSPPTTAEVKKMWIYTSTPPYAFMAQCLIKLSTGKTLPFLPFIAAHVFNKPSYKLMMVIFIDSHFTVAGNKTRPCAAIFKDTTIIPIS